MRVSANSRSTLVALACASAVFSGVVSAQQVPPDTLAPQRLPVVTVTRDVGRSPLELPFAISSTEPDSARPGQRHLSLEETLFDLPGITVSNRNNPSQDPRISIRGFGARSAFGVRSIRVLRDGMPLTLPDGQTPVDFMDLEAVGRVETIRGTASALYGNASGGVIDIRSAPAPLIPTAVQARSSGGSLGTRRFTGLAGGTLGAVTYQANVGRTTADGYREYTHQRLTNGFARVGVTAGGTDYSMQVMAMDMPVAENPGALTAAQLVDDRDAADPAAIRKRARKEVQQYQVGLSATRPLALGAGGEVVAHVYGGERSLYNPLTFAIIGVERASGGAGVRATFPVSTWGMMHRVSVGADAQRQDDDRRNWANCNGVTSPDPDCPTAGAEQGTLEVSQRELVWSLGPYIRDEITLGDVWSVSGGVRSDEIHFDLRDSYLADGDDSGERTLRAVSPMGGIVARLAPLHAAYANVSSAFETPTTTELGNQSDGSAGLNRDLKPQYSTTIEVGIKGLAWAMVRYDVSVFDTGVRDELIPFEVAGGAGRTFYRNAGRTRRRGVEVALESQVGPFALAGSYTYSHFRFRDFESGTEQFAGNAIPGVPEQQADASATWKRHGAFVTAELSGRSAVYVNDANTASAASYTLVNLRTGGTAVFGRPWLSPVLGVSNLFDTHYVGSVAINASGATLESTKFFEPAPGRVWFVGLSVGTGR